MVRSGLTVFILFFGLATLEANHRWPLAQGSILVDLRCHLRIAGLVGPSPPRDAAVID
jgi:hypothetical protein